MVLNGFEWKLNSSSSQEQVARPQFVRDVLHETRMFYQIELLLRTGAWNLELEAWNFQFRLIMGVVKILNAWRTWNLELGACSLELGAWNLQRGPWNLAWNLEFETWNLELATWNLELATCSLELGAWNLEVGGRLDGFEFLNGFERFSQQTCGRLAADSLVLDLTNPSSIQFCGKFAGSLRF